MNRFFNLRLLLLLPALTFFNRGQAETGYKSELDIPYCSVDGKELKINAFTPQGIDKPAPAMVHIHGGWWSGGRPMKGVGGRMKAFTNKGIAIFSVQYRLGKQGGFPENIRDCRNAVRFVRKNAKRFNIDPERIGVYGTSAGSHLSMMVG
ncbi:MAG: alpha/beta hydrolase, partial [Planctomycetota bacterium]|nr:alpha/beta hydrolase [Planctomycetota bacterium]